MKKGYILLALAISIVAGFGYYALSPLFRNVVVDEALPGTEKINQETKDEPEEEEASVPKGAEVVGTAGHPASGTVRIIEAEGTIYVRYDNFKTINGPDIYVYLSKDLDAKEFVNLGRVRATEGNVNYEIPKNVDSSEYRYVLTWCKAFGVLFNYADLGESTGA